VLARDFVGRAKKVRNRLLLATSRYLLRRRGADTRHHSLMVAEATYSPWLADFPFQEVFHEVQSHTLVGIQRCYELWHLMGQVQHLDGDVIEVGVWRGGTGALLAKKSHTESRDNRVYLCDSFRGVVKAGPMDPMYEGGEHADTTRASVEGLLLSMGVDNVEILTGVFPEETAHLIPKETRFRLCHIDVDVYQSAKDVLDWVWGRMVVGGVVVFDDYGFYTCEGITKLVNEEARKRDRLMIHNLNGHALLVKVGGNTAVPKE
jgi:O-methyltransferase